MFESKRNKMKNLRFIGVIGLVTLCLGACKYDDGALWDEVHSLDNRVTSIEKQLTEMNNDINTVKMLAKTLQKQVYITKVTPTSDGYTINFSDGSTATIRNGKDGTNGKDGVNGKDAPVINVKYDNGRYYWVQTLNGSTTWLTDSNGNKIPVTGDDGATPLLKTDSDGYWIVSYDNGNTYVRVKDANGNPIKATGKDGNSFFEDVIFDKQELRLIMSDGTEIVIPIGKLITSRQAVDLGLSVKWASCNVGAETQTEIGGRYLWGDPTNTGNWTNYTPPSENEISGGPYDIAHVTWGSRWRMPTYNEVVEISSNCTWKQTTINGVQGMKVTGKNGNSIFLPATGSEFPASGPIGSGSTQVANKGEGYFWSGTAWPDQGERMGSFLKFTSSGPSYRQTFNIKFIKLAVRPVFGN